MKASAIFPSNLKKDDKGEFTRESEILHGNEAESMGGDDESRLNMRDVLYESLAFFGTLKLLNNLILLCVVYYLGIALTRMQNRSMRKSVIGNYFTADSENSDKVYSSERELMKFYIDKTRAVLNNRAIPDEGSVPLFAQFKFEPSHCSIGSEVTGAIKKELISQQPWCESAGKDHRGRLIGGRHHSIYILKSLNESFGNGMSYEGVEPESIVHKYIHYYSDLKNYKPISSLSSWYDLTRKANEKNGREKRARFGNVTAFIDPERIDDVYVVIPFLLGNAGLVRLNKLEMWRNLEEESFPMSLSKFFVIYYSSQHKMTIALQIEFKKDWDENFIKMELVATNIAHQSILKLDPLYIPAMCVLGLQIIALIFLEIDEIARNQAYLKRQSKNSGRKWTTGFYAQTKLILKHFFYDSAFNFIDLVVLVAAILFYLGTLTFNGVIPNVFKKDGVIMDSCRIYRELAETGKGEPLYMWGCAFDNLYSDVYQFLLSACLTLVVTLQSMKHLTWHPGASVISNTLKHAAKALQDVLLAVSFLCVGMACSFQLFIGSIGGSTDFNTLGNSVSSILRLSFGLMEYHEVVYGGRDQHTAGLGLGRVSPYLNLFYWLAFVIFAVYITNILIAVVGDAYEIHNDRAEVQTYRPLWLQIILQLIYISFSVLFYMSDAFQCCEGFHNRMQSYMPLWMRKMHWASSRKLLHIANLYQNPEDLGIILTDDKSELLHLPGLRSKVDKSIENHVPGFKSKDELRDFVDAAFKSSWINAKRSSFCLRNANEMKSDPVMVEQIWEIFHVAKGKAQNLLNLEEEKGNHI
eukprot:g10161.t1